MKDEDSMEVMQGIRNMQKQQQANCLLKNSLAKYSLPLINVKKDLVQKET